jgi:hypothetical protein
VPKTLKNYFFILFLLINQTFYPNIGISSEPPTSFYQLVITRGILKPGTRNREAGYKNKKGGLPAAFPFGKFPARPAQ